MRYWVVDFGFTHPFVWQAWCEDPDGRLYRYREIYRTQRLVEDHAREIVRLTVGKPKPGPSQPGDGVYVVALGRLRGYAPLVRVERDPIRGYALVRRGGAVAVTIPEEVKGFRGVRRR